MPAAAGLPARLDPVDRTAIARRLGGPATRRRRHRRVAAALLAVAAVAVVLIVLGGGGGDDPGDRTGEVATGEGTTATTEPPATVEEACLANNQEIGTARRALLRDNETPRAIVEFLGGAFVDLTRERSELIRSVDPPPEVLAVVDAHDQVVDAIDADPESAAGTENPFAEVNQRWRDLGLDECVIDASTVPR